MVNIADWFWALFHGDTDGLDPFDENFNFRSRMDGDDYVLNLTDSSEEFYNSETGEYADDAPMYELRVSRIR